jgi:hypothetical protein
MNIFVPISFFSLLVSYDMGIWNKKTTLIKINNNEKGFIQVKETIQTSHQQWNIKKKLWFPFGLVKVDSVWWITLVRQTECPVKKITISHSLLSTFYYYLPLRKLFSYTSPDNVIGKLLEPWKKTIIGLVQNISSPLYWVKFVSIYLHCQTSPCWQKTINRLQHRLF